MVFGRISGPLSPCRDPQPALNGSCRIDRVTRDGYVALRVRAAQTETRKKRFGLDGPRPRTAERGAATCDCDCGCEREATPPAGSRSECTPYVRRFEACQRRFGRISASFSSSRGQQAALKRSYPSDRVTRD